MNVYLDHNATTPVLPEVAKYINSIVSDWGNPSSVHAHGRRPKKILRQARAQMAQFFKVHPLELIFTSGGSESNNSAIMSVYHDQVLQQKNNLAEFITSNIEHPSVAKTFDYIESLGSKVHRISVDQNGHFDMNAFKQSLNENTVLVSVMTANNETGAMLPIKEIVALAKNQGALVHTDAVQTLGKMPLNLKELDVDFASFSAHKVYSLKGCGLLYIKTGTPFKSLIFGGGQERSRRAGTENTLAIASFAKAIELLDLEKLNDVETLRNYMEDRILTEISGSKALSQTAPRLPNTSNIVFDDIDGESLLMNLDLKGLSVSTGAACSSGSSEPSPVLMAMGLSRTQAQGSLRISLGFGNSKEQIDYFCECLQQIILRLRSLREERVSHV